VNYKKEDNLRFSEIPGTDAARNYRFSLWKHVCVSFFRPWRKNDTQKMRNSW